MSSKLINKTKNIIQRAKSFAFIPLVAGLIALTGSTIGEEQRPKTNNILINTFQISRLNTLTIHNNVMRTEEPAAKLKNQVPIDKITPEKQKIPEDRVYLQPQSIQKKHDIGNVLNKKEIKEFHTSMEQVFKTFGIKSKIYKDDFYKYMDQKDDEINKLISFIEQNKYLKRYLKGDTSDVRRIVTASYAISYFTGIDPTLLIAISLLESGMKCDTVNAGGDTGPFQINPKSALAVATSGFKRFKNMLYLYRRRMRLLLKTLQNNPSHLVVYFDTKKIMNYMINGGVDLALSLAELTSSNGPLTYFGLFNVKNFGSQVKNKHNKSKQVLPVTYLFLHPENTLKIDVKKKGRRYKMNTKDMHRLLKNPYISALGSNIILYLYYGLYMSRRRSTRGHVFNPDVLKNKRELMLLAWIYHKGPFGKNTRRDATKNGYSKRIYLFYTLLNKGLGSEHASKKKNKKPTYFGETKSHKSDNLAKAILKLSKKYKKYGTEYTENNKNNINNQDL